MGHHPLAAVAVTSQEPDIMHGMLVFVGTRVPVDIFVDYRKASKNLLSSSLPTSHFPL